ncbi:MAG: cell division/cell wall cluster transcriptional repressor MraZ [Bacteroidales bacterium]|nr:cell division/cell wall cluster transcriptional repressor MraZ [Bacteroidales bacterium]
MSSFIGDYICKVDAKGRIVLPASFKKQLDEAANDTFVIKKDIYEDCLVLHPKDEWQRMVDLLRQKLNPYNKTHKQFLRGFFMDTAELVLDSQNRLTIPKNILAKITWKQNLKLVAQDDKIEVWNPETYQKSFDENQFQDIANQLFGDN